MAKIFSTIEVEATRKPWDFQRRWRSTFLPEVDDWSGGRMQFGWNAIGAPGTEFLERLEAHRRFDALDVTSVFVSNEPGVGPMYRASAPSPLRYSELLAAWHADVYFIALDWSWSFVMTHELSMGIGPFFLTARTSDD